ncbi:hypothetical protein M758_9G046300 [Ceratodon purpureus]|nr:hypothetical protein M758_9G046300 [Ceratodon purpureus]
MVTLLMRAPEFGVGEKMAVGGGGGGGDGEGGKVEGRSRARKGKNAQKKQPQRGLGVAQLEKLRLQEQSKQEAACYASMGALPPPFAFGDGNGGGVCFRSMKSGGGGAMAHQVAGYGVGGGSFGSGRAGVGEKLSHYVAGDGRGQLGKGVGDGDMFRSIVSLASSDHSTAGSFARHGVPGGGGPPVAVMVGRSRESMEHSYGGSSMRTVPSLASLSERPVSRGQGSRGTSAYAEEASGKLPSCVVACLGSPPSSTAKSSLFSNGLTTGVNIVDSLASNVEPGEQRLSEADRESVHMFQVANNGVGDAGMVDAKFFPAVGKNGAGSLYSSSSLQCFESSSGPAKLRRLPQDRAELPVVGLAVNCGRPKELSSFQSFSSNNTWSATEKMCGQKRPWYDLKVNTSKLMHSESLDLNAPAGEVEVAQGGCVAQGHESPVEVHHTFGITRSGLGSTLPLLKDASWQENEVQNLSTTTDVGFHSVDSFSKVSCPPQSKIKDCCSSVCSPCGSPVTRQRCLSSPEVPVLMGADHETSGDFLTLGMSSRSYPTSPQFGVEVDSKESTSPDVGHQVKRSRNSQAEVDNTLQLQMSSHHQESAPSVTGGAYSPSCTENSFLSAVGLSCRFTSTSSSNMTEDCQNQTGRDERREFLDLRLKLAL